MLTADHTQILTMLDDVVAAFRCGDHHVAAEAFTRFETRLVAHLDVEDERLLPALASTDPDEVAVLADEHRRIRAALSELGLRVDLHVARATEVSEFADVLRAHARREDALVYRWADEALVGLASLAVHAVS